MAVSCLSITALFACVDKDARSDLSPNLPTDQAQNGDFGDQGGGSDQGLNFPVFDDGVLAFPGAEGYGKNATGARAGEGREIYHVTNLNDAGPGSFRDAVSKPWRIIVFDVSGVIRLSKDPIVLKSNQTILGHTAPGDGVVPLWWSRFCFWCSKSSCSLFTYAYGSSLFRRSRCLWNC